MDGTQLRTWRKAHGLRQETLADLLGVAQASVSRWEHRRVPLSKRTVKALISLAKINNFAEIPQKPLDI